MIFEFKEKLERKRKIDQVSFNKPGNEEQYKHAKEVFESMENIEEAITENRLEDAKNTIKEGKKIVNFRMKIVNMGKDGAV